LQVVVEILNILMLLHCSDPDAPGGTPVMQQSQVEWKFYLPYNCISRRKVLQMMILNLLKPSL